MISDDEDQYESVEFEIQSSLSTDKKKLTVVIECDREIDPDNPDDMAMALDAYSHQLIKAIKQKAISKLRDH